MSQSWHLAQFNVGTIKYPPEDPRMSGFMGRLDEINALAERSEGFVWRLQGASGNATDIDIGGDALFLPNLSVWESVEALFAFVYESTHRDVLMQRRSWFQRPSGAYQVLWWVRAGHQPTPEEGLEKLAALEAHGPTPEAFSFKARFPHPDD